MPLTDKPQKDGAAKREAKLAQALRANLRRRKAGDAGVQKPGAAKSGEKA